MADEKAEGVKKKPKLATALKRRKQDAKKYFRNRVMKSRIHTARVAFGKAEGDEKTKTLNLLNGLIDKAAKKGIYHQNKASRLKSRLARK